MTSYERAKEYELRQQTRAKNEGSHIIDSELAADLPYFAYRVDRQLLKGERVPGREGNDIMKRNEITKRIMHTKFIENHYE
ncbi:hypothetical protein ANCDUO_00175 [Ancylostoma duodenale]|uniref:Uncharacterized protein n=1 Tax=Ancylostoma duodenale TaxID=51022 RepID=A0A0C2H6K0_9BILA|nr:hypothetical protein ANCDUO_00175 [Ancylostoma duodenale]